MTDEQSLMADFPVGAFTMRDIFDFCVKKNLHNLAQGMIELPPSKKLREITAETCLRGDEIHQYRNRMGEDVYRVAITNLLHKHYKVTDKITKECILATAGVSGGIISSLLTIRNEKKEGKVKVGIITPYYTYHQKQIYEATGEEPIFISSNDDFTPNLNEIEKSIVDNKLDIVMFTNPANPQGTIWKKEEIEKIVQITKNNNCMLLIDEIYCDLVWVNNLFYSPIQSEVNEHVIICRGFSKTLAAQSWRVGYIVSSPVTIKRIMSHADPVYICVNWTQHSFAEYLTNHYDDYVTHIKNTSNLMQENWVKLRNAITQVFGWKAIEPSGSMYGMFKHNESTDKEAVIKGLLKGIGVAPGNIFYPNNVPNTGYIRIHVGISSDKCDAIVNLITSSSSK